MSLARLCIAFLSALALASTAVAQQPASVAMVTDLSGVVKLTGPKGALPSGVATELPAESRVEVATNAKVVLLLYATGEEYTLAGPSSAVVRPGAVSASPPERLSRRTSSVGQVKLKGEGLAQAAVTLRSSRRAETLPLRNLADTVTLETRPTFRWSPVDGAGPYRFELQDGDGKVIFEARTEAAEASLPAGIVLSESKSYTWEVSTRLANGMRFSNFGDFAVAPAPLRAEAARLRPPAGAGMADRVAYAAWLASQDLNDAARAVWSQLAAEQPGNAQLKALSAR